MDVEDDQNSHTSKESLFQGGGIWMYRTPTLGWFSVIQRRFGRLRSKKSNPLHENIVSQK